MPQLRENKKQKKVIIFGMKLCVNKISVWLVIENSVYNVIEEIAALEDHLGFRVSIQKCLNYWFQIQKIMSDNDLEIKQQCTSVVNWGNI